MTALDHRRDGLRRLGWAAAWGALWLISVPVRGAHVGLALLMRGCDRRAKGLHR